jgi:hypothetical protein
VQGWNPWLGAQPHTSFHTHVLNNVATAIVKQLIKIDTVEMSIKKEEMQQLHLPTLIP